MGEAKLKKAVTENLDIERVSMAIAKMCSATSGAHGQDCYLHAALGKAMLTRLGARCEMAIGYAAWRVGDGNADTLVHHPSALKGAYVGMGGGDGEMYHAWVEVGNRIYDPSTYLIRHKCATLDALDGYVTTIDWCPDYLYVPRSESVSFNRVCMETAGLFYYERVPLLEARARREAKSLDPHVLLTTWILYSNPDCVMTGPNGVFESAPL